MSVAMNKMLAVFQAKGYSPRSGISQPTFYAILDQLLVGFNRRRDPNSTAKSLTKSGSKPT